MRNIKDFLKEACCIRTPEKRNITDLKKLDTLLEVCFRVGREALVQLACSRVGM